MAAGRGLVRVVAAFVAGVSSLALVASSVTAAQAVDPRPGRLTLHVDASPSSPFAAGDTVVFTLTATNETGAVLEVDEDQDLGLLFQDDDGIAGQVGGVCELIDLWPDDMIFRVSTELPSSIPAGESYTCTVTHTATAEEVARGGIWAAFVVGHSSDVGWDYSYWYDLPSVGHPSEPLISGDPVVGKQLKVVPYFFDPFDAPLSYQWQRNGVAIAGATGSAYTPTAADVGKAITYRTSAPQLGLSWSSRATAPVKAGTLTAGAVTVAGTAKVGSKLTAKPGSWAPAGTRLTYQWLRAGKPISGATKVTYAPVAADVGKRLAVKVTGSAPGYTSRSVTSKATATVVRGTIVVKSRAKVSGTARVGKKLTAVRPKVSVTGASYSYQWLRSGKVIKSATKSTYTLKAADRGSKVSVKVTVRKAGYTTKSSTSARTKAVAAR